MTQANVRANIRGPIVERGEQLISSLKLSSWTDLIAVLIGRYGTHLEETWEVRPAPGAAYTQPEPQPWSEATPEPSTDFAFDEPLTGL
jgi:hypothetical protein